MLVMSTHTLVLGGTGKTGRRIVERLERAGVSVRVGSRALPFDWYDDDTWAGALDGVSSSYVSYYPDLAIQGAPERVGAFARLAASKGVQRLVLLSGRGEPEAQRAEQEVIAAGAEWTVVRCSWFAQNFSEAFMLDGVLRGRARRAGRRRPRAVRRRRGHRRRRRRRADAGRPPGADLRAHRSAGAALRGGRRRDRRRDRRGLRFVPVPGDAFHAGMLEAGVPSDEAALVSFLFREVLDGRNAQPAGRRAARAGPGAARLRRVRTDDRRFGGLVMILPGDSLENPVTGERFTFIHTAASTGGELLAFDFALRPGGKVPIPHVHPIQTERFEVVSGCVRFRLGRQTFVAGAGEVVEAPPGVAHGFGNAGRTEARMRVEVRPRWRWRTCSPRSSRSPRRDR